LAAGVAGMLTITEDRAEALVGVLVSVATIPAAANIGVAIALRNGPEVWGSTVQLAMNVVGLVVAGTITLAVQWRLWRRLQGDDRGPVRPRRTPMAPGRPRELRPRGR
jgi:hypothetical protein